MKAKLIRFLVLIFCVSAAFFTVSCKGKNKLGYKLSDDGTYYIVQSIIKCNDGNLVIPDTYKKLPVKEIGTGAFSHCYSLTSVEIGDSVTTIGSFAFSWCNSLTSVEIGDGVTTIVDCAFSGCDSLTSVVIGDSVTTIGDEAFSKCSSLTSVVIPDSVTTIGNYAFNECYSLTSVKIGDGVTTIGNRAFGGCIKLVEVINNSTHITVTKDSGENGGVDYYALSVSNCDSSYVSKLTNDNGYIVYTDGEEKIFVGYSGTETALVIPDYITEINQYAFAYCDSLTSVEIGDSITTIGYGAFFSCSSLTSVVIGDSVTTIGEYAFSNCDSLTNIEADANNTAYASIDGNLYNKDCTTLVQYAIGKKDTSFTIPNSVITIGDYAFRNCSSLTSVVIPDSVTTIGYDAFFYCDGLTSVVIGDSVTTIGSSAFEDCFSLTSIKYKGTAEEWSAISKGTYWDRYTGNYTITYNYKG